MSAVAAPRHFFGIRWRELKRSLTGLQSPSPVKVASRRVDAPGVAGDGKDDDAAEAADDEKQGKSKGKKDRRPGPRTVARPALFGAVLLALASSLVPRP